MRYVFGLFVRASRESFLAWYCQNCLRKFYQIHCFSALGDYYKLIGFWGHHSPKNFGDVL